jgi:regulator of sigma E protease
MFNSLASLLWVLVPFIIMLGVLVFVHESGHFLSAKLFGVKVFHYAFGMGPWIFRKKIGETEYGIKYFPIGGSVRLLGDPSEIEEPEEQDLGPEDVKRALFAQPAWKKLIIFAAGSVLNIALAFMIAPVVYWVGIERSILEVADARVGTIIPGSPAEKAGIKPGDMVLAVDGKKVKSFQDMITNEMLNPNRELTYQIQRGSSVLETRVKLTETKEEKAGFSGIFLPGIQPIIGNVVKDGPADKAGLKPDDKIININSQPIYYWHEMTGFIQAAAGKPLSFEVERGTQKQVISVSPQYKEKEKRWIVGIEQKIPTQFVRYGFLDGLREGFKEAYYWSGLTVRTLGKLFSGQVSMKAMSGPVGIASITSQAAKAGLSRFLMLLVIISVNLGMLNLIPIPPLDGAHILFTLIESLTRRPVNKKVKEVIFQATFFLLIGFMLVITFNDLVRAKDPISNWFMELIKSLGIK